MINLILQNYNNKCNNYDSKGEDKMNKEIEKAINSLERMLDICKLEMNELPESMETEMFEVELGNKENHINIIKKALTPPTEDEVCKALSELNILWDVKTKYLYRIITTSAISYPIEVKLIELPPRLIIMLGRFYEGEIIWIKR